MRRLKWRLVAFVVIDLQKEKIMSALAIARVLEVNFGPDIIAYLKGIDVTLAPFQGRFLVHGGEFERLEGTWTGDLIIIEFPTRNHAYAWYSSPAYQEILPLRLNNTVGEVILIDTLADDHAATDVLLKVDAMQG